MLEQHPYTGGRTSSFTERGMPVESGLHRYIGYYSALPKLMKRCGVPIGQAVTWEDTADIRLPGKQKALTLGLAPVFGPIKTLKGIFGNREFLTAKDKLSLLPFFLCGFASTLFSERLDCYSVSEYAEKHHVTPRSQKILLTALSSGIFFLPPEEYSAYAFFGLFLPAIPKFYKMRIGAYLGGMSQVMCDPIAAQIQRQGGTVHLGEGAETLLIRNGAVIGVKSTKGNEYTAPQTVIATSLPAARALLTPLKNRPQLENLFRLKTMSACTLQMELDRPALEKNITTFSPGTDLVSYAEQSSTTFQDCPGRLSVILGKPEQYAEYTEEKLTETVIEQLSQVGIHLEGHVLRSRKITEQNEFYSLGKGSQHLRPDQDPGIPGLILAGDYTKTASFATMEGAVLSGKAAAKKCRKKL